MPWAQAGAGCTATQANVNVGYEQRGLELLRQGLTVKQVVDKLPAGETFPNKDGLQRHLRNPAPASGSAPSPMSKDFMKQLFPVK